MKRKMTTTPVRPTKTWKLPPLILHPFADSAGPDKLVESSRASLMIQGLIPQGSASRDELERRLLDGRYCEIRMLFYVGKDLIRWIEQCMDLVERDADLKSAGICFQSFAALLVEDPPAQVREKLKKWGVSDYKSIFSRALGLNAVFGEAPERHDLSDEFIRHYYRYADQLFACRQMLWTFSDIKSHHFEFEIFASGEYSRILEREWGGEAVSGGDS
ncbi:MAG: hypothetical protein FJW40_10015 [Acidobacteria bacterium]|nr:hypothetical protein [Acidobacteriota bacterium]